MFNCMLIDDDQDEIEIFSLALLETRLEATCKGYVDFSLALNDLATQKIQADFIFLDANLSGIDGKHCLLQIKELFVCRDVPVVILCGAISEEEQLAYKALGAAACMPKPNSIGDLRARLHDFFCGKFKVLG